MARLFQFAEFLAQPMQHAALGDADGAGGGAELDGDIARRDAIDHDPAERAPGALFKLALEQFQYALQQQVIGVVIIGVVVPLLGGNLRPAPLGAAASRGLWLPLPGAEMIERLVLRDRAQPAAK